LAEERLLAVIRRTITVDGVASWFDTGRTRYGVTMITSSDSSRFHAVERNSIPRIGMSPRNGALLILLLVELRSNPAIMSD